MCHGRTGREYLLGAFAGQPGLRNLHFSTDTGFSGSKDGARIQIYTRGGVGDAQWPYETACRITEELEGFIGFMAGDGVSVRVETVNSAQGLGTDTRGRELYSSNYLIYYCDF